MLPYSNRLEWDGRRWIDTDDKEFPNCMDPEKCSRCRTKYVVKGRDGLCYACDPSNPEWEDYRIEALKQALPAPPPTTTC